MKLRFTIRDLLWFTPLVAVLVAWLIDHRQTEIATQRAMEPTINGLRTQLAESEGKIRELQAEHSNDVVRRAKERSQGKSPFVLP
jgi:hypothetical protein